MTVNFDVYPRQALTAADFKALGRSIRRWLRLHAKQQGSVHWYDSDSLDELLRGRPPLAVPRDPQAIGGFQRTALVAGDAASAATSSAATSSTALLDQADSAPPPFCMSLVYNKIIENRQVMGNVRRALSAELVADVLVNGQTWDEPDGD